MKRFFIRRLPWGVLAASFVILAICYRSLPPEIEIYRSFGGGPPTVAPRSLFAVFRVPLIELVCALAILVMLRIKVNREARDSYRNTWLILLYAVAFKSLFQSLETVSTGAISTYFYYATLAAVGIGILLTAVVGRSLFSTISRESLSLGLPSSALLLLLLLAYIFLAIGPMLIYG